MKMDDELKIIIAAGVIDAIVHRNETKEDRAKRMKPVRYVLLVGVLGYAVFYAWFFLR